MAEYLTKAALLKQTKSVKSQGAFASCVRWLMKNKSAIIGVSIFLVLIIMAILAPWIIPYDYKAINIMEAYQGPSLAHWFGTDDVGRDIFSRIIYGGRYSLSLGVSTVCISVVIGVVLGSIAGYFGGGIEMLIMRFLDILSSIPGMLLSITVSAVLGTGFGNTILALSIGGISGYARLIRAEFMSVREKEFVEAAHATNCSNTRIIFRHILPNVISPIIVSATMQCANTLLVAAALSYIGLGVQPPEPEWGAMLAGAKNYVRSYPHMLVFPGLFIMIIVVSLNMFGDALRDALDPKLKH